MIIKSHLFWCKCRQCGREFDSLTDVSWDEIRLLLSKKDRLPAIVICNEDPVFEEIWQIVKDVLYPQELFDSELATRFNQVFGELCDLAPDGSLYDMSGKFLCLNCGSSSVDYGPTDPPLFKEVDAPVVTHRHWDRLVMDQKVARIKSLLEP
jgi:hypothetical protein